MFGLYLNLLCNFIYNYLISMLVFCYDCKFIMFLIYYRKYCSIWPPWTSKSSCWKKYQSFQIINSIPLLWWLWTCRIIVISYAIPTSWIYLTIYNMMCIVQSRVQRQFEKFWTKNSRLKLLVWKSSQSISLLKDHYESSSRVSTNLAWCLC